MQISEIVAALNEEISRLEQVRDLLANNVSGEQTGKRRGRPKGSVNKASAAARTEDPTTPKRQMSEAGRARIAAAQKKRWAAAKQASEPAVSAPRKATRPGGTRKNSKAAPRSRAGKKASSPAKKSVRQGRAESQPLKPETAESAA